MKPNPLAQFGVVVLAIAGLALVAAAGIVAVHSFRYLTYNCGSVLSAKDPRDLAPRQANVPARLTIANNHCDRTRTSRTHKATTFLVAGAIPLLIVLALPAITRRSRRSRRRRVRI